jgi:hypothetical protein
MSRGKFYLIGAALLCLVAIGWLQKEESTSLQQTAAEYEAERISSQASAAPRPPLTKPREFTPPPMRARRGPTKFPDPARRQEFERGDNPGKAEDGNPVPVAARRDGGGQEPEGAQPGERNQPGTPPPVDTRESLLKNGGFDEGLEFWTGKQCEVIPELGRKENSVLEVSLAGDGFLIEQVFQGPAEKRDLTLSFRLKSPEAMEKAPSGIHLEFLDAQGRPLITAFLPMKISEEWATSSRTLGLSEVNRMPASIRFKCQSDEGKLWIDEVTLK